ncbi:hemin receptor [Pelagibius litoralis]|uniref:Hemin receptor n=1 Tax=Pelagibius litoralis TaxID=374515 RepID=A0A967K9Z2_9PROT|nr:hemin receptor [Pelagibius litoralis]
MTSEEAELVRSSFRIVSQESGQAAARFYQILFELAPETRSLFLNDMERQGAMLMSKLGLVVAEIQNLEGLIPVLEDLALRHVAYGVKPEDYQLVSTALLQMLAEVLGDDFTPEMKAAWTKAYDDLSETMINSAYSYRKIPAI